MSSSTSSSKRRKVTVDIKQTKLERGSVFARLGNTAKDKRKKSSKPESESGSKIKKEIVKSEDEAVEERKKTKQPTRSEEKVSSKKSSKEHSRSGSKSKSNADEIKDYKKSYRRYSEEKEMVVVSETGRSHTKHKSDRADRKLEKMENLIIEKRVSPSSFDQSRSASPRSLSPKKKLKKHLAKHSSREKSTERHRYQSQSVSPERTSEPQKHKERGRSREKKKSSKESSKKVRENLDDDEYESRAASSSTKRSSSKMKKASKHGKHEKEYSDDYETEKKHSKIKHGREASIEKEKSRAKISPVIYDQQFSDDNYPRKHEKNEDRGKAKRRKYEDTSLSESPVRHKKSKRQSSVEQDDRSSKHSSPVKHSSKKRSHKEAEFVSKKKVQKEDSLQGTYSDYSSTSKQSPPEFSEISQVSAGIEDQYSSDSYAEKETKKRSKMKKKVKKDVETPPSKSHYEVIDDDFSDDVKKVKKRKRKREERDSPVIESPTKDKQRYREKERIRDEEPKKRSESSYIQSPRERGERSEKHPRDRNEPYERRSPPREQSDSNRHQKVISKVKPEIRSPDNNYHEQRKERERDPHDRRRDVPVYQEPRHSRDTQRYSPERRDTGYSKSKLPTRHLSPERSTDKKVLDWQRSTSKHLSTERKEAIPRLMSMQYPSDRRGENSRPPQSKFIPTRKPHDGDYSYSQHDAPMGRPGHVPLDRGGRNVDRRPPPLLPPPAFSRNRSPARNPSHIRDNRGFNVEQERFVETDRKHNKPYRRDAMPPRTDSRDRKYQPPAEDVGDRRVRSGSRDSRSSHRHSSLDNKTKTRLQGDIGASRGIQSPHSDRNSSLERRDHKKPMQERIKVSKNEAYDRRPHKSLDRGGSVRDKMPQDRLERGRPSERPRPLKRHLDESSQSYRSGSSHSPHDTIKKKRMSSRDSSPFRRRPRESSRTSSKRHSETDGGKQRSSRKRESREKSPEISSDEIDELIKEKNEKTPPSEVDWNELQTEDLKDGKSVKEPSSVLSKFSPGNILRKTGIIMDMLPQHLINKINKLEAESAEKDPVSTESASKSLVKGMLRNGLNAYSDEKLRKRFLGFNADNRHGFYPPRIINAKTYAASMKEYIRKMRLVEAV